ncbi:MAG TPA: hypothetical protein VK470_01270 [Bacteroidota bacterium]|nr:hypothetical protein [Bacteroidota bacterium]
MHNELWLNEIDIEMRRAQEAREIGHEGRLRVSARRMAAIALREYSRTGRSALSPADDMLGMLRVCAASQVMPKEVREAADRLQTHVTPDFTSPSTDPVADAMVIVSFVRANY